MINFKRREELQQKQLSANERAKKERQVTTMRLYIPSNPISFLSDSDLIAEAAAVGAGALVESGAAGAVIAAVSAAAPVVIAGGLIIGAGAWLFNKLGDDPEDNKDGKNGKS